MKTLLGKRVWLYAFIALSVPLAIAMLVYATLAARGSLSCAASAAMGELTPAVIAWLSATVACAALALGRAIARRSLRSGLVVAGVIVSLGGAWLWSVEPIAGHGIRCAAAGVDWPPCLFGCAH